MIVAACDIQQPTTAQHGSLFEAIAATHQADASEYRLVTQPDHARLSGAFASALDRVQLPYLTQEIVNAIATHDIGWLPIDGAAPEPILPPYEADGRLRSFLTTPPPVFLQAWSGSIAHAERLGPAAGSMVSQHFQGLAQFRLQRAQDAPADVARLHTFIAQESARQGTMARQFDAGHTQELLKLLQLCDMISLYLCCDLQGSQDLGIDVGRGSVSIHRRNSTTVLTGFPLAQAVHAECPIFRWRPGSPVLKPGRLLVSVEFS